MPDKPCFCWRNQQSSMVEIVSQEDLPCARNRPIDLTLACSFHGKDLGTSFTVYLGFDPQDLFISGRVFQSIHLRKRGGKGKVRVNIICSHLDQFSANHNRFLISPCFSIGNTQVTKATKEKGLDLALRPFQESEWLPRSCWRRKENSQVSSEP